ncbi:hypothetical protein M422DRAFT_243366 [Sphaerobolus stellatus SS14]|nr:hypothetical protein M422DRAFT_243366 [Sphaerobolus stellatus SS14]
MAPTNSSTPSLINSDGTTSSASESPAPTPAHSYPILRSAKGKEREEPYVYPSSYGYTSLTRVSEFMSSFNDVWFEPNILRRLLRYIYWDDYRALVRAVPSLKHLFEKQHTRDIVLAAFVPGFTEAGRKNIWDDEHVPVVYTDLEDLITLSREIPLYQYPQCAISVLSFSEMGQYVPNDLDLHHRALIHFAQAHSRFVLALRFRAPRLDVSIGEDESQPVRNRPIDGLRTLIFPPSLAYEQSPDPPMPPSLSSSRRAKSKLLWSKDDSSDLPRFVSEVSSLQDQSQVGTRRKRMSSLLRRTPHPSHSAPSSIAGDRHASRTSSLYGSFNGFQKNFGLLPDNESLRPPRRFASSSSSPSSSVQSLRGTMPSSSKITIHSLESAPTRMRAPILRVFVPCSTLSDPLVMEAAQKQLIKAGLWPFLREGDAICNLGYVPKDSKLIYGWLIYAEEALHPFFPPQLPPVIDLYNFPSPLYLAHLVPPQHDLRFNTRLPPGLCTALYHEWADVLVPSPGTNSNGGMVRIWRQEWFANLELTKEAVAGMDLNPAWTTTWVLQMEGTKEGKKKLEDAVQGRAAYNWEMVLDKTSKKKIWLRYVHSPTEVHADSTQTSLNLSEIPVDGNSQTQTRPKALPRVPATQPTQAQMPQLSPVAIVNVAGIGAGSHSLPYPQQYTNQSPQAYLHPQQARSMNNYNYGRAPSPSPGPPANANPNPSANEYANASGQGRGYVLPLSPPPSQPLPPPPPPPSKSPSPRLNTRQLPTPPPAPPSKDSSASLQPQAWQPQPQPQSQPQSKRTSQKLRRPTRT